jgi:hypothetical protein
MTIQDIMDGFVGQLSEAFGHKVYDEEIPQGLATPSFYTQLNKMEFERMAGGNRKYELYISTTFFPQDRATKRTEYNEVLQKISENFDYLKTKDKLLHLKLLTQTENERDDALVFLFSTTVYTQKSVSETEKMREIEVSVNV